MRYRIGLLHFATALAALLTHASHGQTPQCLLKNPGFERQGAEWSCWGSVECAQWAAEAGSCGIAFQGWVMNGEGGFYQDVPAAPMTRYTFTIDARKEHLFEAGAVMIKLECLTSDPNIKAGRDRAATNIVANLTTNWRSFVVSGKTPLGTAFLRPVVFFKEATQGDLRKGNQACLFDNARLVEQLD